MKNLLDILKLILFYLFIIGFDYFVYLKHTGQKWKIIIHKIMNGRMIPMRLYLAYPAYVLLLIALLYFPKNIKEAILLGIIIYGVFNFTIMTIFSDIPLYYGLIDMIWGGLFFGIIFYIKSWFNL
jgi:hypothetical protein